VEDEDTRSAGLLPDLKGQSAAVRELRQQVAVLLSRRAPGNRFPPVLIQGETGTGKGLLARALHRASARAAGPFVDVDCAAIPETLLEAELFGFERGAFTDARQAKPGLLQTASGGTAFLDEVGLLPRALQAKLLKAVEEREVRRLGSTRSEPLDVWILAATNEDLGLATREGRFREDLYHRLAAVTLRIPPLRERGEDILLLAEHFLARACAEYGVVAKSLAPEARAALLAHRWPGNVRELANLMERVALLSEAPVVTAEMLDLPSSPGMPSRESPRRGPVGLRASIEGLEREQIREALRQSGWNISLAAARLGVARGTLRYRIARLGLRPEEGRRGDPPPPAAGRAAEPGPPAGAPPAPEPGPAAPPWEARLLTALRVAVTGVAGAAPAGGAGRALDVVAGKVTAFGGRVQGADDASLCAVFGLDAMEDAAGRAAHAALAVLKTGERAAAGPGSDIQVRIALHSAQCLTSRRGEVAEVREEDRLELRRVLDGLLERAEPSTAVATAAVAALLRGRFEIERLPAGEAPVACRLAGHRLPGEVGGWPLAPFVGRGRELVVLASLLEQCEAGRGQVVGIMGEPGMGKSRLLREFRRRIVASGFTYSEGRCLPWSHALPLVVVREILGQVCGLAEGDTDATVAGKIEAALQGLGMDPGEWAPPLLMLCGVAAEAGALQGLSPEALKRRVFEALHRVILERSRREPMVVAVEDLHWARETTTEFLSYLVERLAGARVLLVCTYRPDYRPPWMDRSYATQLALPPLGRRESLAVVRSIIAPGSAPESGVARVLDRAGGNPFFLEELARGLAEDDRGAPGLPPCAAIHGLLGGRMDRLGDAARRLLRTAAVIGQAAPLRILERVWEEPGSLQAALEDLRRAEFLHEQLDGAGSVYAFAHPMVQEVAYESLPPAERQALHAAVGRALEEAHAERPAEVRDALIHHYSRGDQPEKAIEYLTAAADTASRGHALAEVVDALREALRHAERLPPGPGQDRLAVDLATRQAWPLVRLGRAEEGRALLRRARERLHRLQDPALEGRFHLALGIACQALGEQDRAARCCRRARREATRAGDQATVGRAYYFLGTCSYWAGDFPQGVAHSLDAAAILGRAGERWWQGHATWLRSANRLGAGDLGRALEAAREAEAIGRELGDRRIQSFAARTSGWVHSLRRDWAEALEACQRAVELAPDPIATALAVGWLGGVHLERADAAPAIPLLERGAAQMRQFKFLQWQGLLSAWLAEALLLVGQRERARREAAGARRALRASGFRLGLGAAQRALGRIACAGGEREEAEARFREALETFTDIGARYELARTLLLCAEAALEDPGERGEGAACAQEACRLFAALGVPAYQKRSDEVARALAARGG
jgi:DNA-binding NtrC family response regulator/tetratricopeptide (TPR) repeat protein